MLYESRLEARTRGLVCGRATLASDRPGTAAIITPYSAQGAPLARREFNVAETIIPRGAWRPWDRWVKLVVRAREGGEILWQRPFATEDEAALVYARLIGLDIDRLGDRPLRL